MDRPRDYHTKRSKSEKDFICHEIYVESKSNTDKLIYKTETGNSLMVQWLRIRLSLSWAQIQPLVKELRFYKLCGVGKKSQKQTHRHRKLMATQGGRA